MKNKLQNAPEKSEVFCVVGNLKKERFVLRGGTLRFIFSERFVLRIINNQDNQYLKPVEMRLF